MNEGFDESMQSRGRATPEDLNKFVPGQIVAGKFKVISRLGSGGMGTVYRVEQVFLKTEFALKTMYNGIGSDVMIQRFQLEAKAASSLNHPNLIKVHDYGILDDGNPYLVMDYINGITFAEYLKKKGPIPFESVAPLFVQACFGLMAAHEQSVVHRDIKPANLMLLNNVRIESEGSVKLVDFGIAKLVNREDGEIQALTRTGEIFGSPLYMSPEQCSSGAIDHRSDIYSLGCVLFEMLTGTPPHMGQNALSTMMLHQGSETPTLKEASLGRDFPEPLERIVAKMLRKYPEQRYQNIGLVAHDLTKFGSENRSKINFQLPLVLQKQKVVAPKLVSMTSTKFYTILTLTGLFAAITAGSGMYFFKRAQSKSAPKIQAVSKPLVVNIAEGAEKPADFENYFGASKTLADAKLLEQLPPIKKEEITINDQKWHMYKFPGVRLGEIYYGNLGAPDPPHISALGKTSLLASQSLGFRICGPATFAMFLSPSIFKKIPGNDFQSLTFAIPTDETSELAATDEQKTPEMMEKSVAAALQNLDGWTNLNTLSIKNCSLNAVALGALNNFKKLNWLTLDQCRLKPETLAKQPLLSQLLGLYFHACKFDINPVLNRFSSSSSLQRLAVDSTISVANLHRLQKCPHLNFLQIATNEINDASIAEICGMKKLETLSLTRMVLSDKQVMMLTKCTWLKQICLSRSAYGAAAPRIKAMDPRILLTWE